jgi:hypothetical protein
MAIAAAMRVIFVASRCYADKHLRNRFKLPFTSMPAWLAFAPSWLSAFRPEIGPLHFRKLAIVLFKPRLLDADLGHHIGVPEAL